jgi:hypothetical protein
VLIGSVLPAVIIVAPTADAFEGGDLHDITQLRRGESVINSRSDELRRARRLSPTWCEAAQSQDRLEGYSGILKRLS